MKQLITLKANLSKLIRAETRDGRDYLVAPVVLITEGVHNNILYPAEELQKFPSSWNGRPLPLFHPEKNGQPVTANSPETIEKQSVGQVFNVRFETATDKHPARLIGEAWIDTSKLEKLSANGSAAAQDLAKRLDNDEPIEVSTGLFTDDELRAGKYNEEPFVAVARNHRPDHLALLPGGVGACSNADGCGMPRVNTEEIPRTVIDRIQSVLSRLVRNKPKANELTMRDQKAAIDTALRQKMGLKPGQFIHLEDVGSDFVVYNFFDESTGMDVLRKREMQIDGNDQIILADEDMVVARRTEYIPQQPQTPALFAKINGDNNPSQGIQTMETLVDALIANEATKFTAEDKPALMKFNETALKALNPEEAPKANCGCTTAATAPAVNAEPVTPAEEPKGLTREDVASIVTESLTKALPELITNAVSAQREVDVKGPVIERLKSNPACKLNDAVLETLSAEALSGIEESISPGFFAGRGAVRTNTGESANAAPTMPVLFPAKTD